LELDANAETTTENAELLLEAWNAPNSEWHQAYLSVLKYDTDYQTMLITPIQALNQGFLTHRRQLEQPPHGYFYLMAKKQFEIRTHGWRKIAFV
jgi:hypothetical protein